MQQSVQAKSVGVMPLISWVLTWSVFYSNPPPKDWAISTAFFEAGSISAQSLFVLWLSTTNENFATLFAYKLPTNLVSFLYLKAGGLSFCFNIYAFNSRNYHISGSEPW